MIYNESIWIICYNGRQYMNIQFIIVMIGDAGRKLCICDDASNSHNINLIDYKK